MTRNVDATIVLPSQNEWYKAAYYDGSSASYFVYPAGSDTPTACSAPTAAPNHGNCNEAVGDLTAVGSYTGSASPYGTFDQGGNVYEWNEQIYLGGSYRQSSGGDFYDAGDRLGANAGDIFRYQTDQLPGLGFRLAMIPEPGTGALVTVGLLGFARRRRAAA